MSANLDVDVTTGFGPETITITSLPQSTGELQHFVFIYSSDGYFGVSHAEVKLFGARGLLDTLTVPIPTSSEAQDRYWATWVLKRDGNFTRTDALLAAKPTAATSAHP